MSAAALVLGPWQLRHGEPTSPCTQDLDFLQLPELDLACNALVIDQHDLPEPLFSAQRIPLAAVLETVGPPSIAYLLHAIDRNGALLFRAQEPAGARGPLSRRIARLFESRHLQLNNNECYYTAATPAEAVRAVIGGGSSYWTLGSHIHALIDENAFPPFRPQFRVPPRFRHVDVEAFKLDRPADDGSHYVLVHDCARRRSNWDQRPVTIETISLTDAGTCRRHRYSEIDPGSAPHSEKVATFVERAVQPLAKWRKLSVEIPCESLRTGNVFTVSLEDCQALAAGGPRHRFARIRYEKTRGDRLQHGIVDEVDQLAASVGAALDHHGVSLVAARDMLAEMAAAEARP
jgi:hypothetical protein